MRVFVCTDFTGHYPVGTAAVIIAPDERHARLDLAGTLAVNGLPSDAFTLEEIDMTVPIARILCDGDY